jgi:hypothetical protein
MEWMSTYGGTATAGPNFSYVLATRALRRADQLDLSRLRIALNGAEPVDPTTVTAFIEAGERHGLRPGAVFPAFGMAEVAIAGTFPEPMAGLRIDTVDRRVLETERYAAPVDASVEGARPLAILGRPVDGLEIRVVDPVTGDVLKDREVGELEIRGTSVTSRSRPPGTRPRRGRTRRTSGPAGRRARPRTTRSGRSSYVPYTDAGHREGGLPVDPPDRPGTPPATRAVTQAPSAASVGIDGTPGNLGNRWTSGASDPLVVGGASAVIIGKWLVDTLVAAATHRWSTGVRHTPRA